MNLTINWLNLYSKTDQTSMCCNMILILESDGFTYQLIKSYALRQTKPQCDVIWY